MKLRIERKSTQQASVLMIALFTCCLLGITLGSYLLLVRSQSISVTRSQAWNGALATAEAGVEEAMAQLNPGAGVAFVDRTANGWGLASGTLYGPKTRDLSSGSYTVTYTTDKYPTIYSTGYVTVPTLSAKLTRALRVATTNVPVFVVPMGGRFNIDFN